MPSKDESADNLRKRMDSATKESFRTGKSVNVQLHETKEEKKKLKGKKVSDEERKELDGSGVDSILKAQNYEEGNCGTFSIADKKWNEEERGWDYEFEFNNNFIGYTQVQLNKPEGVSEDEIRAFAYSILLAKQEGELSGVKVEQKEDKETRRVKFFKKY